MVVEILHTERCTLRPVTLEDADWLFDLFNDSDVTNYIEGIKWFNSDIRTVAAFIDSMRQNAQKDLGVMWCIEYGSTNIGFILAYDLMENPFLSFALIPGYRNLHFGAEVISFVREYIARAFQTPRIESANPVAKKIIRKTPKVLFLRDTYYQTLQSFREVVDNLDLHRKNDLETLNNILTCFRDGTLLSWLDYLSETDGEAFDLASALRNFPKVTKEKELKSKLLNVLGSLRIDNNLYETDIPIRLLEKAEIDFGYGPIDINAYTPIRKKQCSGTAKLTMYVELSEVCNDTVSIGIQNKKIDLSLNCKNKIQRLTFDIHIDDKEEQILEVTVDGSLFHKFSVQSYPPEEWNESACLYNGITELYLQNYLKAKLCFEKYPSSAGKFMLGLMSYIGADMNLNAAHCLSLFKEAYELKDGVWSEIANAFMAIMAIKGEGHTIDNFTDFDDRILPYGESGDFVRKSLNGTLKSSDYETLLYSYNMSDVEPEPKVSIELYGRTLPGLFNPKSGRLEIRIHQDWSELAPFKIRGCKSLHAYLGFKVNGEDWHYCIKNDWNENKQYNTFELEKDSAMWKLVIENVRNVHKIPEYECIQQVNVLLRDSTGTIKLEPHDGSCFIIDTQASRPHIALCNLTPLLFKLIGSPNPSLVTGIKYNYL